MKKNRLPLSPDCFLEGLFSQWLAPVESAQMPRRTLGSGSHLRKYHLLCFTQYGGRRELTVGAREPGSQGSLPPPGTEAAVGLSSAGGSCFRKRARARKEPSSHVFMSKLLMASSLSRDPQATKWVLRRESAIPFPRGLFRATLFFSSFWSNPV